MFSQYLVKRKLKSSYLWHVSPELCNISSCVLWTAEFWQRLCWYWCGLSSSPLIQEHYSKILHSPSKPALMISRPWRFKPWSPCIRNLLILYWWAFILPSSMTARTRITVLCPQTVNFIYSSITVIVIVRLGGRRHCERHHGILNPGLVSEDKLLTRSNSFPESCNRLHCGLKYSMCVWDWIFCTVFSEDSTLKVDQIW